MSACDGCMLHKGKPNTSRKLVWVEGQTFEGWGCSECAWLFDFSGSLSDKSLDEMKANFSGGTLRRVFIPRLRRAPTSQRWGSSSCLVRCGVHKAGEIGCLSVGQGVPVV